MKPRRVRRSSEQEVLRPIRVSQSTVISSYWPCLPEGYVTHCSAIQSHIKPLLHCLLMSSALFVYLPKHTHINTPKSTHACTHKAIQMCHPCQSTLCDKNLSWKEVRCYMTTYNLFALDGEWKWPQGHLHPTLTGLHHILSYSFRYESGTDPFFLCFSRTCLRISVCSWHLHSVWLATFTSTGSGPDLYGARLTLKICEKEGVF